MANLQLNGWVNGDESQGFVLAEVAPFDALGCLLSEVTYGVRRIGIDRHVDAVACHQRSVVRDRPIGFDLIGPEVGKRRSTAPVASDLRGDAVALQNVLQRADAEAVIFSHAEKSQDFITAIAVRMHGQLAGKDVRQRFEPQVTPGWSQILTGR